MKKKNQYQQPLRKCYNGNIIDDIGKNVVFLKKIQISLKNQHFLNKSNKKIPKHRKDVY